MKQKSNYVRKCVDRYNRKPVLQYTVKGLFIREWETVGEIFRELGFDKSAVLRCCKGKQKKSYHFIWKFKENEKDTKLIKGTNDESNDEKVSKVFLKSKTET